jgi:hypothetical protein
MLFDTRSLKKGLGDDLQLIIGVELGRAYCQLSLHAADRQLVQAAFLTAASAFSRLRPAWLAIFAIRE